ncbi:hypothetical protein [Acidocella sp. MX-AZ02]|uniref:hypothetical protein n=1 Tax=Acidocella sp. MX-AZ02 TaxID=1214225 RepID=UPI0011818B21|nr:hypothetical protein [Acidocella sp. MX-AZ02]
MVPILHHEGRCREYLYLGGQGLGFVFSLMMSAQAAASPTALQQGSQPIAEPHISAITKGLDQANGLTNSASASQSMPAIQIQPSPQEVEAVAEQEAAKRRIFGLEPDAWVAIFTLVLSLSTIFLWWETRKLSKLAGIQADDFKKSLAQMEISANATQTAAHAAQASADAAKLSSDIAFGSEIPRFEISATNFEPLSWLHPNKSLFNICLRNDGGSKAYLIEQGANFFVSTLLPDHPRLELNMICSADIGAVVESGEEIEVIFGQTKDLSNDEINAVHSGLDTFRVYGYVTYRDFLGNFWRDRFCLKSEVMKGRGVRLIQAYEYSNYIGRERYDPKESNPYLENFTELLNASDKANERNSVNKT